MALGRPAIQQRRPLRCQLVVQHPLCHVPILNPRETVVLLLIPQAGIRHLTGQPFSTVESHMHRERKPALEPRVTKAVVRIQVVMIVMKTFTWLDSQLQRLGLPATPQLDDLARLNAAQNRDQALIATVLGRQAQRRCFLTFLAVVEVLVKARLFGLSLNGLTQRHRRIFGEGFIVHERHLRLQQKIGDSARIAQETFATA